MNGRTASPPLVAEQPCRTLDDIIQQLSLAAHGELNTTIRVDSEDAALREMAAAINLLVETTARSREQARQGQKRLAAALSHELNNPLGVVKSASATLSALAAKVSAASSKAPQDSLSLPSLIEELSASINDATGRMERVMARMNRVTNLDRALVQAVDLNELISDLVAMAGPQIEGKLELHVDLQPLPSLQCRPAHLSTVLSTILDNALEAAGQGGVVRLSSQSAGGHIRVLVEDNGEGLSSDQLSSIFDPGFQVVGRRVRAGNWGLFSARQIVHEHGGEIRLDSQPGEGTTVLITLPVSQTTQTV